MYRLGAAADVLLGEVVDGLAADLAASSEAVVFWAGAAVATARSRSVVKKKRNTGVSPLRRQKAQARSTSLRVEMT